MTGAYERELREVLAGTEKEFTPSPRAVLLKKKAA